MAHLYLVGCASLVVGANSYPLKTTFYQYQRMSESVVVLERTSQRFACQPFCIAFQHRNDPRDVLLLVTWYGSLLIPNIGSHKYGMTASSSQVSVNAANALMCCIIPAFPVTCVVGVSSMLLSIVEVYSCPM